MTADQQVQQLFLSAQRLHQAGQVQGAETLYRQALALNPRHADTLQMLGVLSQQTGRSDQAVALMRQAIDANPNSANIHVNLGVILGARGETALAVDAFRRATAIAPDFAEAYNNLAKALKSLGRTGEAYEAAQRAVDLRPNNADAINEVATALEQLGRLDEAAAMLRRALKIRPQFPEALNNLGSIVQQQGNPADALPMLQQALAMRPQFPEAMINLGNALHALCRYTEAVASYRRAIELQPSSYQAWSNLSIALLELDDVEASIATAQQAIAVKSDYAAAHQILGFALKKAGRLDEAADAFRQCIALEPTHGEAIANLANCLRDVGLIEQAIPLYRQAMTMTPVSWPAESLIYTLYFRPGETAESILQEHRQWNDRYVKPITTWPAFKNTRDPNRRLRIGYVSPDFRNHCQAQFTIPLLANHDHANVEIYCYSTSTLKDAITQELQKGAEVWREVAPLKDKDLAELIRADGIDVLVDLTMHMDRNRLFTFAQRAAPVQTCWLAYPGTTGLAEMDYRVSDPYLDPPGNDALSTEKTIRLPHTFWIYDPLTREPSVNELPALTNGFITFGCFNNFVKVSELTLNTWAAVLGALPDSRLLLLTLPGSARNRIRESFQRRGIDLSRIELMDRQTRMNYLKLHHRFDLCIDTFPYNGHTTTLDSVWMGVPPLTAPGETTVSRGGFSILSNLGLADLAATDLASLPQKAIEIASELPKLAAVRASLREQMRVSPLMSAPEFVRDMESAYRRMWRAWCQPTAV
jgi:protein O-GlcNAc transferase